VLVGEIREGDIAALEVDGAARASTMAHHTATHLLHAALRETLGTHVKQAGSLVAPTHLRFDFHHFAAVERDLLGGIEEWVNEALLKDVVVRTEVMPTEEAVNSGAMALFGEKYGAEVRVVSVPGFSKELCGGTHVPSTGHIGLFKITSEHSVSAGVRRIEAVTHMPAYRFLKSQEDILHAVSAHLNMPPERAPGQVEQLLMDNKKLEKELSKLRLQLASCSAPEDEIQEVEGIKLLVRRVEGLSPSEIKNLADSLRDRIKSGVVVIGNRLEDRASLTVAATKDMLDRMKAVDLARPLGKIIGGGGGGRPDIAEAGGKLVEHLDEALQSAKDHLKEVLHRAK
jgi:alanyl-tRNA synthetase